MKSWLPILNIPTRSEIFVANFAAEDKESKSSATIKLLRGWASKLKVMCDPDFDGVSVFVAIPSIRAEPDLRPNGSARSFELRDRIHQFRVPLDRDLGH